MTDKTQLAQLIATRLCHDLAGPVGAVAAGVELVGDDPSAVDQETLGLIGSSSAAASHKLKFLRIAFGTPASSSPAALGELHATVQRFLEASAGTQGPPPLTWPDARALHQVQAVAGAGAIQALFNLLVLVLEGVPKCARLDVVLTAHADGATICVTGQPVAPESPTAIRSDIIDAVTNPERILPSARTAQALYAVAVVADLGGAISMALSKGELVATAELPCRTGNGEAQK